MFLLLVFFFFLGGEGGLLALVCNFKNYQQRSIGLCYQSVNFMVFGNQVDYPVCSHFSISNVRSQQAGQHQPADTEQLRHRLYSVWPKSKSHTHTHTHTHTQARALTYMRARAFVYSSCH